LDNENNTNLNEEWVTVEYEADLDEQKEKLGRKKISPKNFKYIIAIILCILAITLFYGTYLLVANNKVVKAYENKVYPGIYLLDKEVGGLTEGELKETIKSMVNDIRDREIKVTIEDNEFKTNYWNIDVVALTDDIEKEIMAYGKDKGFFAKLKLIQKPAKKEYTFSLTCDEEKLSSFVNGIGDQVNMEPKNATIDITAGAVTVEAGKNGYELNVENLIKSIKEKISDVNNKNGVVLTAELTEVGPSITEDALKNVNGKISSFTTYFSAGPSGHNIQVAAEYVDNTIIMPGETFLM
jgi:vancomycin resistance protein YoaR